MDPLMEGVKRQLSKVHFLVVSVLENFEPEDRLSVLGSLLAGFWFLLLLLNPAPTSGCSSGRWVNRACKLNVVALAGSLLALKLKIPLGCLPAILMCILDVILCSYFGISSLCSLVFDSIRSILRAGFSLLLAGAVLLYAQALYEILPPFKFWFTGFYLNCK